MDDYGQVAALAKRGDALRIAGEFNSPRKDVMAVDVRTGAQLPAPDWDARVLNMVLAGDTLFLGGDRYLRAFDAASGAPTGWDANPDDVIWGLAVSGSTLHVTGRFNRIAGRLESGSPTTGCRTTAATSTAIASPAASACTMATS